ncbi:MAG: hypothetical protein PVJ49_01170 [Acidobacteriota bacterium]|jgi:hypothetical protein
MMPLCRPSLRSLVVSGVVCLAGLPVATASSERGAPPTAAGPELQVRVAAVPELVRQPGWFSGFHCATARASELLAMAVGRRLHIRDRVVWVDAPIDGEVSELRRHLIRNVEDDGADLVIGLVPAVATPPVTGIGRHDDGLAAYSQGYVALRVGRPLCNVGRLLAHEVAHIFGGIHRRGDDYLMDPLTPGTRVDELNAALFELHRDRMIRTQQPPLQGEMLRMMWRLTSADLDSAITWLRVGALAATMGKNEIACRHYERAAAIDPTLRTAWVNLGHARLQLEQFSAAEDAYLAALDLGTGGGLVYNNLAVVYLSLGRLRRARESMNHALELGYDVPAGLRQAIREAMRRGVTMDLGPAAPSAAQSWASSQSSAYSTRSPSMSPAPQ